VIGIVAAEEWEVGWDFPSPLHRDNIFAGGPAFTSLIAWGRTNFV
jgi:hypothetical protein